jgi:hypothetical protein
MTSTRPLPCRQACADVVLSKATSTADLVKQFIVSSKASGGAVFSGVQGACGSSVAGDCSSLANLKLLIKSGIF